MSSKRNHSKSRTGCKQCKSRRIKCDETPPCCLNCARKGLECEYKDFKDAFDSLHLLTPAYFASPGQLAPPPVPSHPQSSTEQAFQEPDPRTVQSPDHLFSIEDLGLIHSFTLSTSLTLPLLDSDEYRRIWQYEVPVLATYHPFLMHALLGTAAAHKHSSTADMNCRSLNKVRLHYSKALTLFLQEVHEVDEDRADAVLCFSLQIAILTLYLDSQKGLEEESPIEHFVHLLNVLQSASSVLETQRALIERGRIGVLLSHLRETKTHAIDPIVNQSIDKLVALTHKFGNRSDCHPDEYTTLMEACDRLRIFYTRVDARPATWMFLLSFPITINPSFGVLLQRRNPVALCILAHWCAPVWHAPVRWFSADYPKRLMHAITLQLQGLTWSEGLEWPLSATVDQENDL